MSNVAPARGIADWLDRSALRFATRPAVEDSAGRCICYRDLDRLSRALAAALVTEHGARSGERIGVLMAKSIDTVAAFYGVLRTGAAYVPVDPLAPVARAALLLADCGAKAVLVDEELAADLQKELNTLSAAITLLVLPRQPGCQYAWRIQTLASNEHTESAPAPRRTSDLAFLLYTSGSTGAPKAVRITHENVLDFVDWCSETFAPTEHDRFATQSPLQFSLPVFNLYVACKHGGAVCLIDDRATRVPSALAPLIERLRATVWFSTPAVLSLLSQAPQRPSLPDLRLMMWGGESLPAPVLCILKELIPHARYVHVLGSTETHIMAHYELPATNEGPDSSPIPVGQVSKRFRSRIVDEQGNDAAIGTDGELFLAGSGVTPGYWKPSEAAERAFSNDAQGQRWYRTGDIVRARRDGNLLYRGRRDRMVKKRGNRIELGEIEACLSTSAALKEVAVVAVRNHESDLRVCAFVVPHRDAHRSIIELKGLCARTLPSYMVPDTFSFLAALPRTSTGKIDYPALATMADGADTAPSRCADVAH